MKNFKVLFTLCLAFSLGACSSSKRVDNDNLEAQLDAHEDFYADDGSGLSDDDVANMYQAAGMEAEAAGLKQAAQRSTPRSPASTLGPNGAFWTLAPGSCSVHAAPSEGSEVYNKLKDQRSLWVQASGDPNWVMVQRRAGPGYMQSSCFQ